MNSRFLKLGRLAIAVLAVAMLFLIGGCALAPTAPLPTPEKIELGELQELERNIVIEAEGGTLHYFEEKKWAEDEFSRLIQEEDKFSSNQVEEFNTTYRVNAGNFGVETDKKEKSTILKCEVYTKPDTYYDFHWFLKPLGLDFIDDHFERLEMELKQLFLLNFPLRLVTVTHTFGQQNKT